MKRLAVWILSVSAALAAGGLIGVAWNERAADICREQAGVSSDGDVAWEWEDFAFVCEDSAPGEQPKRVGVVDAFHGEKGPRHGIDP
jgi:hypothetical protein